MTSGIRRTNEMFLSEIHDKYGSEYTVLSEYKKAHEKVLVRHEKCGCEWEIEANSLLRKARCPMCNGGVSFSESEFKRRLFNLTARNSPTSKVAGCKGFGLVQGLAPCA